MIKKDFFATFGTEVLLPELNLELMRLAMMSVADTIIFPKQDLLGLEKEAIMNRPATSEGNWQWRVSPEQSNPLVAQRLAEMTTTYGRGQSKRKVKKRRS